MWISSVHLSYQPHWPTIFSLWDTGVDTGVADACYYLADLNCTDYHLQKLNMRVSPSLTRGFLARSVDELQRLSKIGQRMEIPRPQDSTP
jgi:hypothetical protein